MAKGAAAPRRRAMIDAALAAIHAAGSADVTVADIARRAGCSSALAHHYFGTKEAVLLAALRRLLADLAEDAARRLRAAPDPRARVSAVIAACFGPDQFRPQTVSAWLAFYALAQRDPKARRLLRVYFARLRSNLVHALAGLASRPEAQRIAAGAGAMIDGLYLRHGLIDAAPDPAAAAAAVEAHVDARLRAAAVDLSPDAPPPAARPDPDAPATPAAAPRPDAPPAPTVESRPDAPHPDAPTPTAEPRPVAPATPAAEAPPDAPLPAPTAARHADAPTPTAAPHPDAPPAPTVEARPDAPAADPDAPPPMAAP